MAGFWPRKRPVLLAARWDGVIPLKLPVRPLESRDVREIMSFIRKQDGEESLRPGEYWLDNGRDSDEVQEYSDSGRPGG